MSSEQEPVRLRPLVLLDGDVRVELRAVYDAHRAEAGGVCSTPEDHPRAPFVLWSRHVVADQERTILWLVVSVLVLLMLKAGGASVWVWVVCAVVAAVTLLPYSVRGPRILIVGSPTPEQVARWPQSQV